MTRPSESQDYPTETTVTDVNLFAALLLSRVTVAPGTESRTRGSWGSLSAAHRGPFHLVDL